MERFKLGAEMGAGFLEVEVEEQSDSSPNKLLAQEPSM